MFMKKSSGIRVFWLLSLAYMSSHNSVRLVLVTHPSSQWENQPAWIPLYLQETLLDSLSESLPTPRISLIRCSLHGLSLFLYSTWIPLWGSISPTRLPLSPHSGDASLLLGAQDQSPLEMDKLWNMPSPPSIIIHELRRQWQQLYLFYWHISNICLL